MNLRYRLVTMLCHLLRHRGRTEVSADGWSRTSCRCGWISIGTRSFHRD